MLPLEYVNSQQSMAPQNTLDNVVRPIRFSLALGNYILTIITLRRLYIAKHPNCSWCDIFSITTVRWGCKACGEAAQDGTAATEWCLGVFSVSGTAGVQLTCSAMPAHILPAVSSRYCWNPQGKEAVFEVGWLHDEVKSLILWMFEFLQVRKLNVVLYKLKCK